VATYYGLVSLAGTEGAVPGGEAARRGRPGLPEGARPTHPPAAVLFDLYDTLVHASAGGAFYLGVPAALGVDQGRWLACYRALGRAAMLGDVPDMTTRVWLACRNAGRPRDQQVVAAVVREQLTHFYAGISLDPQALTMLDNLRAAGLRLGIVSNAASASERLLDIFGLRARMNTVAMSCTLGVLKPDPRIYRAALDALGADAGDAAFVGDGRDGELRGARQLGLRTVLIERGLPHTGSARAEADLRCGDLAGVMRALLPGR
jgi:putative hydrolase of the HAD superfamily